MLRSVVFSINANEPDLSDRRIMFEIYDGRMWSEPAFATVTIIPINDNMPEIALTSVGEVRKFSFCHDELNTVIPIQAFVEGSEEAVQLLSSVTLSDMDHQERFNLTQARVHTSIQPTTHMHVACQISWRMNTLSIHGCTPSYHTHTFTCGLTT